MSRTKVRDSFKNDPHHRPRHADHQHERNQVKDRPRHCFFLVLAGVARLLIGRIHGRSHRSQHALGGLGVVGTSGRQLQVLLEGLRGPGRGTIFPSGEEWLLCPPEQLIVSFSVIRVRGDGLLESVLHPTDRCWPGQRPDCSSIYPPKWDWSALVSARPRSSWLSQGQRVVVVVDGIFRAPCQGPSCKPRLRERNRLAFPHCWFWESPRPI